MVAPTDHKTGLVNEAKRSGLVRRDPLSTYMAFAVDPENSQQTTEIFEFLKAKTSEPERIHQYKLGGKVIGWSRLAIPDAEKANIEAHPGIMKPLEPNKPVEYDLVVPNANNPNLTRPMTGNSLKSTSKRKRNVAWTKQEGAVKDLRMVSQPK